MAKRKKPGLSLAILRLVFGLPAMVSLLARLGSLIGFEARLAGRSLVGIIVFSLVCALLITSSWLCVLALLFVYLMSLQWSLYAILFTLLGINLLMLLVVLRIIHKYNRRLSFPKTRHLFHEVHDIYKQI